MIEDKILSGYAYEIKAPAITSLGKRRVNLHTGRGGVLLYIDACRDNGIPDEEIEETIICYTDMGPYPVSVLTVQKINK